MSYRLRTKDESSTVYYTVKSDIYDKPGVCTNALAWRTYGTGNFSVVVGKKSSMSDVVVPGFNRRRNRGDVFFNPMTKVSITVDAGSGQTPEFTDKTEACIGAGPFKPRYRFPITGATVGRTTSGFGFPTYSDGSLQSYTSLLRDSDVAAAITEASTTCLNQRGRADSNLYETLYEADKILGTVPGIVKAGLKSISQKSGLLGRARDAGSAYLAYRYGLKPLMSDLEAVQKGLLKTLGKVRQTARGSVTLSGSSTSTSTASYGGACTYTKYYTKQETLVIRAMSLDEYIASLTSNVGFTNKGLLTLPWEIIPYSFVVDWFVNIGDFIGSVVPSVGYNQLGSCLVSDGTLVESYSIGNTVPNSNVTLDVPVSGTNVRTWNVKSRSPGPLSAGIVIKSDFRLGNIVRAADAISLILQKIR